jgi:hypothetical protein
MIDSMIDSMTTPVTALPKRLVLGCGALVHEMVAILNQNPRVQDATKLHCLPAKLHNTPQFIAERVDQYLAEHAHLYDEIFIAYGDCGTAGELDKVLLKYSAERMPGAHCYEFYAGSEEFQGLLETELGSFFLTDYLVRNFKRLVIEGLGINRYPELFDDYFKHYRKMVYLAQTHNAELQMMAHQYAADFGWEYEYRWVGVKGMSPVAHTKFAVEVIS